NADDVRWSDHITAYEFARQQAEVTGVSAFDGLKANYTDNLLQEKEKVDYGFKARERSIERIGLPEVRAYRLAKLQQEQKQWLAEFVERQKLKPDLNALLILRIKPR
ncbi:hypothetical protein, partial [Neptunomonas phycophila]